MQPEAQAALRRVWLKQELIRYQQRSEAQPDNLDVLRQIGRICWELGDVELALVAVDRMLALQPGDRALLLDRGVACLHLRRFSEVLATTEQLLALAPNDAEVLWQQFEALRGMQRATEALAVSERLLPLVLPPVQRLQVLYAQTILQVQLSRREEALVSVEQALALAPDDVGWRLSRGRLLYQLRRYEESLVELEALVAIPDGHFTALCTKVRVLAALRRFTEADVILDDLRGRYPHAALEREFEPWRLPDEVPEDSLPKRYTGRGLYLMQAFDARQECDWSDWDVVWANIDDLVKDALQYGFVAGLEAHSLLSLPIDPALQLAVARAQATAVDALMTPVRRQLAFQWTGRQSGERLRIGYVSGDFRDHATAHLIRKLFRVHDREQFEIFGYSLRPSDGSDYWRDISQTCDQFVEVYGLSNADAAARIAADGIHVLVDLHGYTRFARPEIFALRPAPVQVAFLGYAGSLGADYVPYIIADPMVLPEGLRPYFSEQPVYLDCYQINDDEQPIAETGMTRADVNLPEKSFVYCCFNNAHKIEPGVFSVWMQILRQVSGSVLWLLADTSRCADHLRAAAQRQGVAPERLIFAPRLPKAEHLERHRLADLFLDTFIYNAHTTASDALWAGLPVLTRPGLNFQSRVCTSLLSTLGLQEWVVKDNDEYKRQAIALARDQGRLQEWRARLAEHRTTYPLFSTECFARQIEQSFLAMWDGHVRSFSV
ncbi:MAG: hypothetical protein H6974_00450 [Gammaproteobacteria bacterium]|nr:hypothetical protein [Gammaproteobacteria bacterium]MCP5195264.1 hypothetical protein [Gammaproteobacteria bacterium]